MKANNAKSYSWNKKVYCKDCKYYHEYGLWKYKPEFCSLWFEKVDKRSHCHRGKKRGE